MSNVLTKLSRRVALSLASLLVLCGLTVAPPASAATGSPVSNGCAVNARGVDDCNTLVGAAYGSNTDPAAWEKQLGQNLGVRRTYWRPDQIDSAVRTAKVDLAAGRTPWVSFKLPHNWADMASGKGDAWARDLAAKFAKVDGSVWIAFHHEPEGDEPNIQLWTRTQERLGPILRKGAPNAAFTVILTGWNQLYGPAQFRLDNMWPNTTVDVAGFDVYSFYGTHKNGKLRLGEASLKEQYFKPISEWAKSKGVAWGLAETGLSDRAHKDYPEWISQTAQDMRDTGGVALAYFNTTLNSTETYRITAGTKTDDFRAALKSAPKLSSEPVDHEVDLPGVEVSGPASVPVDVYTTPGQHFYNEREWRTTCEPYSRTTRCRTEIWATQIRVQGGRYVKTNGWVFNNLTYAPSAAGLWVGNPLAVPGSWTASDGRKWKTECFASTLPHICRSFTWASFIGARSTPKGWVYFPEQGWVFNNQVHLR